MMVVNTSILEKYGAKAVSYKKGDFLFLEKDIARFYYQVDTGVVKMNNYSPEGQEFIQGMFKKGESFGEPPLFTGFPYPANAVAMGDCRVWKLPKDSFIRLLRENFELHFKFCAILSNRLQFKAMIAKEISSNTPEHRILTLISYFRQRDKATEDGYYEVPFTRQQIADMTGLRVETVIRTVKGLAEKDELRIINRKIYQKA